MKVFSHFFSIIIIASISAPAQAIDLSGYYENTLMPEYSDRAEDHLLDASKLRLDFSTGGGDDNLEFRGNVNFIAYHSDIILDVTPYLPESIADSLHEREIPAEIRLDRSRIFLDNAYLTWRIGQLRLRAGRQQLSWGPAYSFNPTDLFHKKDLFDPTYEKEGVTALRLDYRWGVGGQVALVTVPSSSDRVARKTPAASTITTIATMSKRFMALPPPRRAPLLLEVDAGLLAPGPAQHAKEQEEQGPGDDVAPFDPVALGVGQFG